MKDTPCTLQNPVDPSPDYPACNAEPDTDSEFWCDECRNDRSYGSSITVIDPDGEPLKLCANHWVEWLTRNMDRADALPKIQMEFAMSRNEAATEWTDAEQRLMLKAADACVGKINKLVEVRK